jgi:hypothetical protein
MDDKQQIQVEEEQQKAVAKDQDVLNKPLEDPTGFTGDDKVFLETVVKLVNDGKIDLYKPASLMNQEFYKKLSEEKQGQADLEAVNLLSVIRDIKGLYDAGMTKSFQIQNQVQRLKETKERLEEGGDLFII